VTSWGDSGWLTAITGWAQRTTWIQQPVLLFTNYSIVLVAVAAVWLVWRARHQGGAALAGALWIPIAMLLAPGLGLVIKSVVAEPRPCRVLPDLHILAPCDQPTDYSFPSNHTAICAAFAIALFLVHRRWGLLAGVLALLMAMSRMVVGVHYPHDVIAGLLLGGLVGVLGLGARPWLALLIDRVTPAQWRREAAE
jgi:undecaprenyl-diphosphatase